MIVLQRLQPLPFASEHIGAVDVVVWEFGLLFIARLVDGLVEFRDGAGNVTLLDEREAATVPEFSDVGRDRHRSVEILQGAIDVALGKIRHAAAVERQRVLRLQRNLSIEIGDRPIEFPLLVVGNAPLVEVIAVVTAQCDRSVEIPDRLVDLAESLIRIGAAPKGLGIIAVLQRLGVIVDGALVLTLMTEGHATLVEHRRGADLVDRGRRQLVEDRFGKLRGLRQQRHRLIVILHRSVDLTFSHVKVAAIFIGLDVITQRMPLVGDQCVAHLHRRLDLRREIGFGRAILLVRMRRGCGHRQRYGEKRQQKPGEKPHHRTLPAAPDHVAIGQTYPDRCREGV